MARPRKDNAEYFSHDAGMRNDPKMKALRRQFGHEGYALYNMLLEVLTDADFFQVTVSDINLELWAGDFDTAPVRLAEVIDYCVRVALFVRDGEMLYSEGLKKRLGGLVAKRQFMRDKSDKKPDNPPLPPVSDSETPSNPVVPESENPQSKVKESKERERDAQGRDEFSGEPGKSVDSGTPPPMPEPEKPQRPAYAPTYEQASAYFYQCGQPHYTDAFMRENDESGWVYRDGSPIEKWQTWAAGFVRSRKNADEKSAVQAKKADARAAKKAPPKSGWIPTRADFATDYEWQKYQKNNPAQTLEKTS